MKNISLLLKKKKKKYWFQEGIVIYIRYISATFAIKISEMIPGVTA